MNIWVDADACPKVIKEILFRAAMRTQTTLTLVANQPLYTPASSFIKTLQVPLGFDVADHHIIERLQPGDLVITGDVPLADLVIAKGGAALNPRGKLYSKNNIKQCLLSRNINEELRSNGVTCGGPASLSKKEIQAFANYLDQYLSKPKS